MRWIWSSLFLLAIFFLPFTTAVSSNDIAKSGRPDAAIAPTVVDDIRDDFVPTNTGNRSLGSYSTAEPNPYAIGVKIGDTWIDQQHNGSMGRMIDWGINGDTMLVHFSWMHLNAAYDAAVPLERTYRYNYYNATTGQLAQAISITGEWSGFVGIDVQSDNVPIVGGHERTDGIVRPTFLWDSSPGAQYFPPNVSVVPDTIKDYGAYTDPSNWDMLWPRIRYQEGPTDTVLHVLAEADTPYDVAHVVYYFRKIGIGSNGAWDYPPYIIDTAAGAEQDIAASKSTGKVALVWMANLSTASPCDTNSGRETFSQVDNDLYYQVSHDQGITWEPRVNLTCNVDGEDGYRPFNDLSALIDIDDNLHIAWVGRVWPADAYTGGTIGFNCSIFHWSESVQNVTKIHDAEWDQTMCSADFRTLNVGKLSISVCDGRFYCLWVQFNDIPNGIEGDCAERAFAALDFQGSANGDLWFSVSRDDGLNWDRARNLTNTYSSICTPGECLNEHWPSMARFGTNLGSDWSGAEIPDPTNSYSGDYYLDVQYVLDTDPGLVTWQEGTWQLAEIRWFRLPCVDSTYTAAELCCIGNRGNVNGDPEEKVNIADITCIIGYLFGDSQQPEPECEITCVSEANANGDPDETINISDVTFLVSYLFGTPGGPAPGPCPY